MKARTIKQIQEIPKMGKKKPTPAEAGKGLTTAASYYPVVEKPTENKNEEKQLKNDEIAVLSAGNNDNNDNDNYSTITTTIRTEERTIMGPNTAPTDEGKDVRLGKTNKEESEHSGEVEEDEDGSIDIVSDENQEIYFNNRTEKVTNMGTVTEPTNVGILLEGDKKVEGLDKTGGEKSRSKSNNNRTEEGEVDQVKTHTNENENETEQELSTGTEEATIMGADKEVIGGSGLQKHAERFHAEGTAAARTEDIDNRMTEATEAINSKRLIKGTISGQAIIIDGWDGRDSD